MKLRRKIGQKGQIVIPKVIRESTGIKPNDEIEMEIREKEVVIRPGMNPERFVESFCSVTKKKLTKKVDLKKLMKQELRKDLLYIDSNVFVHPVIYNPEVVSEAKKSKNLR
jgi:AbrB family looped-hinge helix DNA binding protein